MNELLSELIEVLDLASDEGDVFVGRSERARHSTVYGGQFVAQSLVAAARTAPGRPAHSLHAYFLQSGDPTQPLCYGVERVRDGRSFSHRRVTASQGGHDCFHAQLSLQPLEKGFEHQLEMPDAPRPEDLPTPDEMAERVAGQLPRETASWATRPRALEMRHLTVPANLGGRGEAGNLVWFRADAELRDDPVLHQALIAYATDMSFNDNAARPHARSGTLGARMASLDHCIWFHVPARADDWLLFQQESPRAAGARGFVRGSIFTRDGAMVATVVQECLLRPYPDTPNS